jgi:hypothetical protein
VSVATAEGARELTLGPVMTELLALAARVATATPAQAFPDLGYKGRFRLDLVGARDDDVPEHVHPFASDHNSYYGFFTRDEPATTDVCPIVFVDWGAEDFEYGEPPVRIIAVDLASFLSQLAFGEHDDAGENEGEEYEDEDDDGEGGGEDDEDASEIHEDVLEQRRRLALVPGVSEAKARAEVPRKLARIRFAHESMLAYDDEFGGNEPDEDDDVSVDP